MHLKMYIAHPYCRDRASFARFDLIHLIFTFVNPCHSHHNLLSSPFGCRGGANIGHVTARPRPPSCGATPAAAECEYARSRLRTALHRRGGTPQSAAGAGCGRGEHQAHGPLLRRPRSPQQLLEVPGRAPGDANPRQP